MKQMTDDEIHDFVMSHGVCQVWQSDVDFSITHNKPVEVPVVGLITVPPAGKGKGKSQKITNVLLSYRKLAKALATNGIMVAGVYAAGTPILIIGAFLVMVLEYMKLETVELTETESLIVFSLFVLSGKHDSVSLQQLNDEVTTSAKQHSKPLPGKASFDNAIKTLVKIGAIKMEDSCVILTEETNIELNNS